MLNDFVFAAVDTFLKTEAQKMIDRWVSETAVNQLVSMIPNSGRAVPVPVRGTLSAKLSGITIDYTGTAMRKTQDRQVQLPDQEKELAIDRVIPARPGATVQESTETKAPPAAEIFLNTGVVLSGIGISEGMGGLKAKINGLKFQAGIKLLINQGE